MFLWIIEEIQEVLYGEKDGNFKQYQLDKIKLNIMFQQGIIEIMKLYQESNINDFSDIEAQSFNQYFATSIDAEYFQIHSSFLQASWMDIYDKVNTYLLNHNIEIQIEVDPYDLQKQHENAVVEVVKLCLAVLLVFNKRFLVEQLKKVHIDYQKEVIKEIDELVDEIRETISKNYLFYIRENKDKNELIKKLQEVIDKNTSLENALLKINEEEGSMQKDKDLLKKALENKKREIKEFNFEIKKLSDQLEKQSEDFLNAEEEIRQLIDQNKNLVKQKNQFYDKMVIAEQKYEDLLQAQQNLQKLVQRNNMLQKELDEAQNQIERDRIKVEGYDQMVKNDNEMKQLLNSNNMTLKDYKEKQKSHIDQIMKYEKEIKDKNQYINHLETQNSILERNYNEIQKDFKIYKSHAKAQVNDETFSMDNFDINKTFDVTNPMGESLVSEKMLSSTIIQEGIKKHQQELQSLQDEYDQLKKRSKQDTDELLKQIEDLQMQNYNLEQQINSHKRNSITDQGNNEVNKEQEKNIKKLQKDLEKQQQKFQQEIADLQQQINVKDQRIRDQDKHLISLQDMIKQPIKQPSLQQLDTNNNKDPAQTLDNNKGEFDHLKKENQLNENALNKSRKTLLEYQLQQQLLQEEILKLKEELKRIKEISKQRGDELFYIKEQNKKQEQELQTYKQNEENQDSNKKSLLEKISQLEQKNRELQRRSQQSDSKTDLLNQIENLKGQINNNSQKQAEDFDKQKKRLQQQIQSLKNSLKVYSDKDQENEQYIKDLYKKIDSLNQCLQESQKNIKVKEKVQYVIEEKYKPISQEEFDYTQISLMYSTFMGYYSNHLKYDSYMLKRVQDTKKALTKNFSIGRLLND